MIVFTNGCFDQIHIGHIRLFKYAYSLGECTIIVGLNSDESVRRLKGPDRPVYSQEHRKEALESIVYIREVYIFEDDTPITLIEMIMPDIIVKGADYANKPVVGSNIAKVVICPAEICFPHKDVQGAINDNIKRGMV